MCHLEKHFISLDMIFSLFIKCLFFKSWVISWSNLFLFLNKGALKLNLNGDSLEKVDFIKYMT